MQLTWLASRTSFSFLAPRLSFYWNVIRDHSKNRQSDFSIFIFCILRNILVQLLNKMQLGFSYLQNIVYFMIKKHFH